MYQTNLAAIYIPEQPNRHKLCTATRSFTSTSIRSLFLILTQAPSAAHEPRIAAHYKLSLFWSNLSKRQHLKSNLALIICSVNVITRDCCCCDCVSAVDCHSITMTAVIGDRQESSAVYFYKTHINRLTDDKCHHSSQCARQAAVTVQRRSSIFWYVTPCTLIVTYRRFETTYRSIFKCPAVYLCFETIALNNNRIGVVKEVHGVFIELRTENFKSIETQTV